MPELLVRPSAPDSNGRVLHVTPQSAGWTYVGFDLHKLQPGQAIVGTPPAPVSRSRSMICMASSASHLRMRASFAPAKSEGDMTAWQPVT